MHTYFLDFFFLKMLLVLKQYCYCPLAVSKHAIVTLVVYPGGRVNPESW